MKRCQMKPCKECGIVKAMWLDFNGNTNAKCLCIEHAKEFTRGKPIVFKSPLFPVSINGLALTDADHAPS